jgi:hypothetical protein
LLGDIAVAESILCPKCNARIEVTEVLAAQMRARLEAEFADRLRQKDAQFAEQEAQLTRQKQKIAEEKAGIEKQRAAVEQEVTARLAQAREELCRDLRQQARKEVEVDLKSRESELLEIRGKLQQAQQQELALRKQKRDLEEQKNALELEVVRRVDAEIAKARDAARKETLEERQLKEKEKDKTISDLLTQIEEMKRKAEQGSQQLQGEVLEIDLEESLRRTFPLDDILPVAKGTFGGDVNQRVRDAAVGDCGLILWESKRTKHWNNDWLAKLKDDQRAAKAQIAILVSDQLPAEVGSFALCNGVWVTNRACAMGLSAALRSGLIQLAAARRAQEGQHGKMEILYNYLSSEHFKLRIEGIIEPFMTLREQLESEKRSAHTAWAKREKQLDRALASTCGLYGDLGGIIGKALPSIEQLNGDDAALCAADGVPIASRFEQAAKLGKH